MVTGMAMYGSFGERIAKSPKTVEEFEAMMKESVKIGKTYVSPFVKKTPENKKEVIIHDPQKNPFAPLYRPDKEVIYTKDKYHIIDPPRVLGNKKEEPKKLLVAVGAGSVPPSGGGGTPPEKDPKIFNINLEKIADMKNSFVKENLNNYNKTTKFS